MVAVVCNMCGIIVTLSICFCPRDRKSINVGRCDSSRDLHIFSASSQPPTLWGLTRHVVNRQLGSSLSLTRTDMHQRKAKVKRSHGRSQLPAVELLVFFPSVYMYVPHRKSLQRSMINPERRFLPSSLYYLSPRIFRTRNDTHRTAHVVTLRTLYRLLYIYIYIRVRIDPLAPHRKGRERERANCCYGCFSRRELLLLFFLRWFLRLLLLVPTPSVPRGLRSPLSSVDDDDPLDCLFVYCIDIISSEKRSRFPSQPYGTFRFFLYIWCFRQFAKSAV